MNKTLVPLPDLGEFEVVPTVNAQDCVDPRVALPIQEIPEEVNAALPESVIKDARREGAVKSPGGTFGIIMSLGAAMPSLDPNVVVDLVAEWEIKHGRRIEAHADTHADGSIWGCGHHDCALKPENQDAYGIACDRVAELSTSFIECIKQGNMEAEMPVLGGDHKEKAVMIIDSENSTVVPQNGENEVFRYDRMRHEKNLKSLSAYVREKGYRDLTDAMLQSASDTQLNATLGLLAKGLPVYTVVFEGGEPKIAASGTV